MEIKKSLSFEDEARISFNLLKDGFTYYSKISEDNEHYDTSLFLIGGGLEKLSKLIILLNTYDCDTKEFWTIKDLKNKVGHDLVKAKDELLKCYENDSCRSKVLDEGFIRSNSELKTVLTLLSTFMGGGRFDNLDMIASSKKKETVVNQWITFTEGLIGPEALSHEIGYSQINERVLAILVRYVRSLVRIVNFDCLPESVSSKAKSVFVHFGEFNSIEDDQLGAYFVNCANNVGL